MNTDNRLQLKQEICSSQFMYVSKPENLRKEARWQIF